MWNGTAAILKPKPTRIMASPTHRAGLTPPAFSRAELIATNLVTPRVLYTMLTPYSNMAEENAPTMMYFKPASFDLKSLLA